MEFALTKDVRWDIFEIARTTESFKQWVIPEIQFKPEVNEEIVRSFDIVKKLLVHTYYEYEFFDVAGTLVMLKFEMALKIRYKELENIEWPEREPLFKLIDWFFERNFWEITNKDFFDNLRKIRNREAHPVRNSLLGLFVKNQITTTVNLINELYENVELRMIRFSLANEANKKLHFIANGAVVQEINYYDIIYNGFCLFVNNKVSPPNYYLFLCPIFYLNEIHNISVENSKKTLRSYIAKEICQTNNGVEFWDEISGQQIKVTMFSNDGDIAKFNSWKDFVRRDMNLSVEIDFIQSDLSNEYQHIRREFLKA